MTSRTAQRFPAFSLFRRLSLKWFPFRGEKTNKTKTSPSDFHCLTQNETELPVNLPTTEPRLEPRVSDKDFRIFGQHRKLPITCFSSHPPVFSSSSFSLFSFLFPLGVSAPSPNAVATWLRIRAHKNEKQKDTPKITTASWTRPRPAPKNKVSFHSLCLPIYRGAPLSPPPPYFSPFDSGKTFPANE